MKISIIITADHDRPETFEKLSKWKNAFICVDSCVNHSCQFNEDPDVNKGHYNWDFEYKIFDKDIYKLLSEFTINLAEDISIDRYAVTIRGK